MRKFDIDSDLALTGKGGTYKGKATQNIKSNDKSKITIDLAGKRASLGDAFYMKKVEP